jgi:hypothetical protein
VFGGSWAGSGTDCLRGLSVDDVESLLLWVLRLGRGVLEREGEIGEKTSPSRTAGRAEVGAMDGRRRSVGAALRVDGEREMGDCWR